MVYKLEQMIYLLPSSLFSLKEVRKHICCCLCYGSSVKSKAQFSMFFESSSIPRKQCKFPKHLFPKPGGEMDRVQQRNTSSEKWRGSTELLTTQAEAISAPCQKSRCHKRRCVIEKTRPLTIVRYTNGRLRQ